MNWRDFQTETSEVFKAVGCEAEIGKTVKGARGNHNVDVYVKFKKYGIDCTWIIECKCWNSNVPKEKVAALQSIVSDLGADRGVIISKVGFQSGAIRLAQNSNITLASLDDLKDYLKEEIEQREIDFIERQLTHLKYDFLNLSITEKTQHGFKARYPEGIDDSKVIGLGGKVCVLLMSFEQIKIGNEKFPYGFDESGKVISTNSIEEFLEKAKDCIVECHVFLSSVKSYIA